MCFPRAGMHTDGKWQRGESLRPVRIVVHSRVAIVVVGDAVAATAAAIIIDVTPGRSTRINRCRRTDNRRRSFRSLQTTLRRALFMRGLCAARENASTKVQGYAFRESPRKRKDSSSPANACLVVLFPRVISFLRMPHRSSTSYDVGNERIVRLMTDDRESSSLQHHREYVAFT